MSALTLEQRVARLERRVAACEAGLKNGGQSRDWRSTIGMFTGNEGMQQIFEEALKIRAKDRERARRRQGKKRKAIA
jgi:hypothetical protein